MPKLFLQLVSSSLKKRATRQNGEITMGSAHFSRKDSRRFEDLKYLEKTVDPRRLPRFSIHVGRRIMLHPPHRIFYGGRNATENGP